MTLWHYINRKARTKKATKKLRTKENKRKNRNLKKKDVKKIKKEIILIKSNISMSFKKNISTLLNLKTNCIIAILVESYANARKNLLRMQSLAKTNIIVKLFKKKTKNAKKS